MNHFSKISRKRIGLGGMVALFTFSVTAQTYYDDTSISVAEGSTYTLLVDNIEWKGEHYINDPKIEATGQGTVEIGLLTKATFKNVTYDDARVVYAVLADVNNSQITYGPVDHYPVNFTNVDGNAVSKDSNTKDIFYLEEVTGLNNQGSSGFTLFQSATSNDNLTVWEATFGMGFFDDEHGEPLFSRKPVGSGTWATGLRQRPNASGNLGLNNSTPAQNPPAGAERSVELVGLLDGVDDPGSPTTGSGIQGGNGAAGGATDGRGPKAGKKNSWFRLATVVIGGLSIVILAGSNGDFNFPVGNLDGNDDPTYRPQDETFKLYIKVTGDVTLTSISSLPGINGEIVFKPLKVN